MKPHPEDHPRGLLPWPVLLLLLALMCGWGLMQHAEAATAAPAGERRARLTVEMTVEGQSEWRNGSEWTKGRTQRQYKLVTTLRSDGQLLEFNTKDPRYAQQMMDRAAQVQARVAQAQGRQAPATVTPQQMGERAQQAKAACGENRDCLMRAAMQLATLRVAPAGAAPVADTLDTPPEARYLAYNGIDACGAQFHEVVNDRSEGQYADVQGPVAFSTSTVASGGLGADALRLLCLNHSLVLDTRTNTFTTDAGLFLPETTGRGTRTERGRTDTHEAPVSSIRPVSDWVAERTRQAPRSGTAKVSMPATGTGPGAVQGVLNVSVSWKLEDL